MTTLERISEALAARPGLAAAVGLSLVLLAAALALFVAHRILLRVATRLIRATRLRWDDSLLEHHVLHRAAWLAPLFVVYYLQIVKIFLAVLGGVLIVSGGGGGWAGPRARGGGIATAAMPDEPATAPPWRRLIGRGWWRFQNYFRHLDTRAELSIPGLMKFDFDSMRANSRSDNHDIPRARDASTLIPSQEAPT